MASSRFATAPNLVSERAPYRSLSRLLRAASLPLSPEMPSESSEVTASEAKKFTVAQLKAALESRGLPTDGRKDALLARLLETLEGETAGDLPEENENGGDESEDSGRKRKRDEDIADEDEGDETRKRAAREESEEAPGPMPGPEPTNGDDDEGDEVGPTFDMIAPGNGDEDEDVGPMPSGGQARKKQRREFRGDICTSRTAQLIFFAF